MLPRLHRYTHLLYYSVKLCHLSLIITLLKLVAVDMVVPEVSSC